MVIHRSKHLLVLAALIAAQCTLLAGCRRASAARYPFRGRVVSIDTHAQTALIDAEAIPGFMEAMAMNYKVQPPSTLSQLAANDTISADVVVVRSGGGDDAVSDYWLENVKVTGHGKEPPAQSASAQHLPAAGESVPNFTFTNQNGKRISIGEYQGKTLLITFIYTRCPFPDFCPRMTGKFAEIYKQSDSNPALAKTQLLSVSFDPEHDTPKVLRDYGFAAAHTHDAALFNRWQFAVPKAADLPKIADFFALTVKPEGGMITHNLSTAVIGPDGKIVHWYHGSDWQVSDLIKDASVVAAPKT
jgi:protein SCO1/2